MSEMRFEPDHQQDRNYDFPEQKINIWEELKARRLKILKKHNIPTAFPDNISRLTKKKIETESFAGRKDFRSERAFTIDCADCRDMDDAVSITRKKDGYRLAVHIADVSAYVPLGSDLDQVAVERANSFYFPDLTIPMLPKILSNELCSLNPGKDRLTMSVIMQIDAHGEVRDYTITKAVIRSRVKGVYSEINELLAGRGNTELKRKYKEVLEDLHIMKDLYSILRNRRVSNGAEISDNRVPVIDFKEDSIELISVSDGTAESMIEEFMIAANTMVAEYMFRNGLMAIYRIQEKKEQMASYSFQRRRHAELVLDTYTHFTSPIRRIADLKNHQILTMYLLGYSPEKIKQIFASGLAEICEHANERSRIAKNAQTYLEKVCYALYFKEHTEMLFKGHIVRYNKNNKPIFQILGLNIEVYGYELESVSGLDDYEFHIGVDDMSNNFYTYGAHIIFDEFDMDTTELKYIF